MQNTMKQARAEYRRMFSTVRDGKRVWRDDAPGLRSFVRSHPRAYWSNPVGKLAQILRAS